MYQTSALAIYVIKFVLLLSVLVKQYHLQGAYTKLKNFFNKMDYTYEFRNLEYILLLVPDFIWEKNENFLMYCT
jgi:hypothetical protein